MPKKSRNMIWKLIVLLRGISRRLTNNFEKIGTNYFQKLLNSM